MSVMSPILCSTARLARSLRQNHARAQAAQGLARWQPLPALTLAQWLDEVLEAALLAGEVPAESAPREVLTPWQERLLWERAIDASLGGEVAAALFDRAGMAAAAQEANQLLLTWEVSLPAVPPSVETGEFLRWREAFRTLCEPSGWLEQARYFDWQVSRIARDAGRLPPHLYLAGFDRVSPQEQRLFDALTRRGVTVERWPLGQDEPGQASQLALDDADAECRAAAAWAAARLAENPQARLAIVAPELATLRTRLAAILDDTLHPECLQPARAQQARRYDFSLGEPLSAVPLVASALSLLRLAARSYRLEQAQAAALLQDVYWSAAQREADARAQLEARMRRKLGNTFGLEHWLRFLRAAPHGAPAAQAHLEALQAAVVGWPSRQTAPAWVQAWTQLLAAAGWPGERSLSSHEYQACQTWQETLADFARLDRLLGRLDAATALQRLAALCRERIFQPEAEGEPQLLVMGMLEASAAPLDALWVMGMNDHQWPPPARPNALLPAAAQRAAGAPGSCSRVQADFARTIHARLQSSAPQLVFSWARKEGDRELRPSPLLAGLSPADGLPAPALSLMQRLAQPAVLQRLDDHRGPPLREGEKVAGGAALLRAQAICPAWAFYRYRLGARALEEPVDGLDSAARGSLLHAVLQCFWSGRSSQQVAALAEAALQQAVAQAVDDGVRQFADQRELPLPPHFLALEKMRLAHLLQAWVGFELARPPFTVEECERRVALEIEGIAVELTLDRVDLLEDGRLVVLDYKTGSDISQKSWAEARITEPQLPLYAALALSGGQVAAVCFAKVRTDEQKFVGIAEEADTLPGVKGLEEARRLFPAERFPDWASVLGHWAGSIAAVAREIRAGDAAVRFRDESELAWCEVKPLLRLPERKLQLERGGAA